MLTSYYIFLLFVIICNGANVPLKYNTDRMLHIRSIPPVKGYNSQIYEVLMQPFIPEDKIPNHAVAEIKDVNEGKKLGDIEIKELENGLLKLTGIISNLNPKELVGISVHDSGDCNNLGQIFRPDQPRNSLPNPEMPAGFIISTIVPNNGKLELNMILSSRLALSGRRSILARGLALHKLVDNDGIKNKRGAIGCGVIGRGLITQREISARRRRHPIKYVVRH